MAEGEPDFYLTTAGEYGPLAAPRACWVTGRIRDEARDDHMLVEIDPPLHGQYFGLGGEGINTLILSARHEGETLFPVSEWPAFVYVTRLVGRPSMPLGSVTKEDVDLIAWGTLFRGVGEATAYAMRFPL